jgi:hypothetical protein
MSNPDQPTPDSSVPPGPITRINRLRMAMDHELRIRLGLVITVGGFIVFMIGCQPGLIGMDHSLLIGIVQIVVFLVGLLVICIGGYISVIALWKGQPLSIPADIGLRLVGTGYVISFFCSFADVFGFGSHKPPNMSFFGPWQARGVVIGELVIAVGFFMLIPLFFHPPALEPPQDGKNQDKPITVNIS